MYNKYLEAGIFPWESYAPELLKWSLPIAYIWLNYGKRTRSASVRDRPLLSYRHGYWPDTAKQNVYLYSDKEKTFGHSTQEHIDGLPDLLHGTWADVVYSSPRRFVQPSNAGFAPTFSRPYWRILKITSSWIACKLVAAPVGFGVCNFIWGRESCQDDSRNEG